MHKKFKALTKDIGDLKDNIMQMQKKNELLRDHHKLLEGAIGVSSHTE